MEALVSTEPPVIRLVPDITAERPEVVLAVACRRHALKSLHPTEALEPVVLGEFQVRRVEADRDYPRNGDCM
jgi:hypothetical protein